MSSVCSPAHEPRILRAGFREDLRRLVDSGRFQAFIAVVIVINAVGLGLETSGTVVRVAGPALDWAGRICLGIFIIELCLRLAAHGWRFFKRGWNLFDFAIVVVTAVPAWPNLSVLRALRILRALRCFSIVPQLRVVVQAMVSAIPSMGSILFLLAIWFYIAGVLATQFFGSAFDDWFGNIGRSMYSLFQIMTLESWSMGIVRPVMKVYPTAWMFFVPFITVTTFTMLNLFIAVLVSATQKQEERREAEPSATNTNDQEVLAGQISLLRHDLAELRKSLENERAKVEHGPDQSRPPRPANAAAEQTAMTGA